MAWHISKEIMKNAGKIFEQDFTRSAPEYVGVIRLPDAAQSFYKSYNLRFSLKNPYDFLNKRPLNNNIEAVRQADTIENVETHILSICRENSQVDDKNVWLDKYAPFFKKENRVIISRESQDWKSAREIKTDFLKNIKTDKQIVVVDDDNEILKFIHENYKHIIVMQDSELVD